MSEQEHQNTPWYRQFWPWFIIALPASVVVAGFVTLYIAIKNDDSLVRDNYYKDGMGINQELAEDKRAIELGIQAKLTIDPLVGEAWVELSEEKQPLPAQLKLFMIHPTTADKDFELPLLHVGNGRYRGDLEMRPSGRWYIHLEGGEPELWRIRNEMIIDEQTTIQLTH